MNKSISCLFILLCMIAAPIAVRATQPEYSTVVIDNLKNTSPEIRDWVVDSILAGKYVEVLRSGPSALVSVHPNWPGYPPGQVITIDSFEGPSRYSDLKDSQLIFDSLLYGSYLVGDLLFAFPNDPKLLATIQILTKNSPKYPVFNVLKSRLKELLTDHSLGYPPGTLWKNPTLKSFVLQNRIDQLAPLYGHKFGVRTYLAQPLILVQGELVAWMDVPMDFFEKDTYKLKNHIYTIHGIESGAQDGDIRLIQQGGTSIYGHRYVMEVNQNQANQSWIRLYAPDGDTYSFGWESGDPFTLSWKDSMNPYYTGPYYRGRVISPAPQDGLSNYQNAIKVPIEISAEQMAKALEFARAYQHSPDVAEEGRATGTKDSWHFVNLNLRNLGISVPLSQQRWVAQVKEWRDTQMDALQANQASEEDLERARFALP